MDFMEIQLPKYVLPVTSYARPALQLPAPVASLALQARISTSQVAIAHVPQPHTYLLRRPLVQTAIPPVPPAMVRMQTTASLVQWEKDSAADLAELLMLLILSRKTLDLAQTPSPQASLQSNSQD